VKYLNVGDILTVVTKMKFDIPSEDRIERDRRAEAAATANARQEALDRAAQAMAEARREAERIEAERRALEDARRLLEETNRALERCRMQ